MGHRDKRRAGNRLTKSNHTLRISPFSIPIIHTRKHHLTLLECLHGPDTIQVDAISMIPYEIGTISSPLLRMRKTRHRGIKYLPPKAIVYRISNFRAHASNSLRTSYTRLSPKWTFCPGLCVWHQYALPCPF